MSEGNVESIRWIYDHWARGDFETSELMDEHALMVVRPEFPDTGTYLGLEGVARYTRGFLEPWTQITIEAEEIIPTGDSVIVAVRQQGEGEGSGAVTEFRYFHLWTFRGGKAIRLETIRERDEAFEAAGLTDG